MGSNRSVRPILMGFGGGKGGGVFFWLIIFRPILMGFGGQKREGVVFLLINFLRSSGVK